MGPVEKRIRRYIDKHGTICFGLLDSEDASREDIISTVKQAEECGILGILLGGSTAVDQLELDSITSVVKSVTSLPVILFPGNVTGISPKADAVLFSSLLNSEDPYFIIQSQALGALLVKRYGIEAIPMGYIVIGEGGTIGFIGRARGIPPNKPNIASMYALAAQYMGMRFVYLEAGSGVTSHVPSAIVSSVRQVFDGVLIVGGGIKSVSIAKSLAGAGADILVIGTLLEKGGFSSTVRKITSSVRR